jgi:hypothetical protein
MILMLVSGAWGKMIYENLQQKISRHCPFKYRKIPLLGAGNTFFSIL